MNLIEVKSKKEIKEFLETPKVILGEDPNYIRVLDKDVNEVFSPNNKLLKRGGKHVRYVLKDEKGKLIGRIAAFINPKYKNKINVGGVGFFDCIDDQEAADLLFDTAKHWLQNEGMEAMDGPINLGERDRFWGLVVEGFYSPVYGMNYVKPYYQKLYENYGFQLYFNQYCYGMNVTHQVPEKFDIKYQEITKDPNYVVKNVTKDKLDKYAKDFCTIYNKAWASHGGGKTMSEGQAKLIFKSMKPILDSRIALMAYYKDEPVGMWMNIPDLNTIMSKFNGRFGLLEKIRFMIDLKRGAANKAIGIIFGIVPEHQSKGVDALMITEGDREFKNKTNYKYFEIQWIGDFNPKMVNVAKSLGGDLSRTLVTYRYLFDRDAPYERHPII